MATADGISETLTGRGLTLRWDLVDYFNRKIEGARRRLGEDAFQAARARGADLTDADITAFLLHGAT